MRSASGNGSGRSRTPFTRLKIAVFAPMPSARVKIAMMLKPGVFNNIRTAYFRSVNTKSLFSAQRLNWIDKCGAARRQQTRNQRRAREEDRRTAEQRWIVRRDLEQLRCDQASQRKRRRDANHEPDYDRAHALADNELEHVARLGAERHADADFSGALFNRVCDCTVNSDACQQERNAGKNSEQPRHQPRLAKRLRDHCVHCLWRRSEEHTSELQSHSDLVCRLPLEKKK